MGDWGIKISQEGFDVKTAQDKDLVMHSSLNMLKTAIVGDDSSVSVPHGLGYAPVVFTQRTSGGNQSIIGDDYQTTIDDTNVNLGIQATTYYIFYHQID